MFGSKIFPPIRPSHDRPARPRLLHVVEADVGIVAPFPARRANARLAPCVEQFREGLDFCVAELSALLVTLGHLVQVLEATIDSLPEGDARRSLEDQRMNIGRDILVARRVLAERAMTPGLAAAR